MEITYLGNDAFRIRGERVITINSSRLSEPADIVLHSERKPESKQIVNGPGEYEIGGVLILTIQTGSREAGRLAHSIDLGDLTIVHLGSQVEELDERSVAALGRVDVLLVSSQDLAAARCSIQDLEPRVIIPFGPRAGELCAACGIAEPPVENRFTWNGTSTAPKAVLLRTPASKRRAA